MTFGFRHLLAGEAEGEPVIWDVNHVDYYRKDKKNAAFERICQRLCELGCGCTVPEIKKEWKSVRDAHNRDRLKPQSVSAARPIAGMRRILSLLNTSHVSGPRMTIMVDNDDYDFLDENDPPSPSLLGRKKEEPWTSKKSLRTSKKSEYTLGESDEVEPRRSPFLAKEESSCRCDSKN